MGTVPLKYVNNDIARQAQVLSKRGVSPIHVYESCLGKVHIGAEGSHYFIKHII